MKYLMIHPPRSSPSCTSQSHSSACCALSVCCPQNLVSGQMSSVSFCQPGCPGTEVVELLFGRSGPLKPTNFTALPESASCRRWLGQDLNSGPADTSHPWSYVVVKSEGWKDPCPLSPGACRRTWGARRCLLWISTCDPEVMCSLGLSLTEVMKKIAAAGFLLRC